MEKLKKTCYFTQKQIGELDKLANVANRSRSAEIQLAVDYWLKQNRAWMKEETK